MTAITLRTSLGIVTCLGVLTALIGSGACTGSLSASPASSGYSDLPSGGSGSGGSVADGLPCEIAATLSTYCTGCHGNPPSGNAPFALLSYEDLAGC